MFKFIKKADILLIIFLLVAGIASSLFLATGNTKGDKVTVTINGKIYGNYPLNDNRTIDLKVGNILSIYNGCVYMKNADCKGKDCVHQGKISRAGERIVCLPHKVIVEVKGGDKKYDSISQ